jgi:hypothetical protein
MGAGERDIKETKGEGEQERNKERRQGMKGREGKKEGRKKGRKEGRKEANILDGHRYKIVNSILEKRIQHTSRRSFSMI